MFLDGLLTGTLTGTLVPVRLYEADPNTFKVLGAKYECWGW